MMIRIIFFINMRNLNTVNQKLVVSGNKTIKSTSIATALSLGIAASAMGMLNGCESIPSNKSERKTAQFKEKSINFEHKFLPTNSETSHNPCVPGSIRTCGGTEGECTPGIQTCDAKGHWELDCVGSVGPSVEECNEKDDNCNGYTDEWDVCLTQ